MRFFRDKRWRRFGWSMAFLGVMAAGVWLYLAATRTPVNAVNFMKLDTGMSLEEVESILGGAAARKGFVEDLITRSPKGIKAINKDDGFHPIPGMWEDYSVFWAPPQSDEFGEFAQNFEVGRRDTITDKIVEVHIWNSS